MQLSVIYPAYNEEAALRETVERSIEALRPRFSQFEILLIDDCSRDATGRIADELGGEYPEVRVLHNERNLGQGASLCLGFAAAVGNLVVHNAVDYPFHLEDLDLLMPLATDADVIVAVRGEYPGYSAYRTVLSAVNRWLIQTLFPLRLSDYNFVQLYRKDVLEQVKPESRSTGFLVPELLVRAHDRGFRIRSVKVEYHAREIGVATSGRPRVVLSSLRDMVRFWRKRRTSGRIRSAR